MAPDSISASERQAIPVSDWGRRLVRAPILFAILFAPVLFLPFTYENFDFPKMSLVLACALAVPALAGVVWALGGGRWEKGWLSGWAQDRIGLGLGILLVSAVVSTVLAVDPVTAFWGEHRGHRGLLTFWGYFVLYQGARWGIAGWGEFGTLMKGVLAIAWVAVAYGLLQMFGMDPLRWDGQARFGDFWRPPSTLGHPIPFGTFLALCFPWVLHFGRQEWDRPWAAGLWILLGGAILLATLGTYSRGAWLSLAAGGAVWCLLGSSRRILRIGVLVLGSLAVAGIVLFLWNPAGIADGLGARVRDSSTWTSRLVNWDIAWRVFLAHPIFGVGPDNFHLVFPAFRTLDQWHVEWNTIPTHAHNEFLQILTTQGLVGGIGLLVLIAGAMRGVLQAWKHGTPEDRGLLQVSIASLAAMIPAAGSSFLTPGIAPVFLCLLAGLSRSASGEMKSGKSKIGFSVFAAAGAAVVAVFGINFFWGTIGDPGMVLPASLVLAAALGVGFILGKPPEGTEAVSSGTPVFDPSRGRLAIAGAVCLVLLFLGARLVWLPLRGSSLVREGAGLSAKDPLAAVESLQEAGRIHPQSSTVWEHLAAAAPEAAETVGSPERRKRLYLLGEEAFLELIRRQPGKGSHRMGLARIQARMALVGWRRPEEALAHAREGAKLETPNPIHLAGAVETCLALGHMKEAERFAEQGLARFPNYGPLLEQAGYLALRDGKTAHAVHLLERALVGHRDEGVGNLAAARANLVAGYHRLQDWDGVRRHASEALKLAPHAWTIRLAYGDALERLRLPEQALEQYDLVLRAQPHHEGALRAHRRLQGLVSNTGRETPSY